MEVTHTGGGTEATRAGSGQGSTRIGGGQGFTRARSVDGRRGVRGERGNARADSPKAPGRPEGDALGSVIKRRQRTAGAEERHWQAQPELTVRVSDLDFIFRICILDPPILLT